jgi:hypothetical protein
MTANESQKSNAAPRERFWPPLLLMGALIITVVAISLWRRGPAGLAWEAREPSSLPSSAEVREQRLEQEAAPEVAQVEKNDTELTLPEERETAKQELEEERLQSKKEQIKLLNALYTALRDHQASTAERVGKKSFVYRDLPHAPEMMVIPAISLNVESYFEEESEEGGASPPPDRSRTKPFAVGLHPLRQTEYARCEIAGTCPRREEAAKADSSEGFILWLSRSELSAYATWLNQEIKRKTGKPGRYRPMTIEERGLLSERARLLKLDEGLVFSGMGWLMQHRADRLVCDLP